MVVPVFFFPAVKPRTMVCVMNILGFVIMPTSWKYATCITAFSLCESYLSFETNTQEKKTKQNKKSIRPRPGTVKYAVQKK